MPNDKTMALVEAGKFLCDRLDELEFRDGDYATRDYYGHVEPALERFRAAVDQTEAAEITHLRAALQPFAKAADMYPDMADNVAIQGSLVGTKITFGDLRRARDVWQAGEGETE